LTAETALNTRHPDKAIWAIAGPAILANSSAPLVGLVDTWVVGHLPGAVHLAAVGVGAAIFSFMFWGFGFLRMSTTGLIAQAHGNNDTTGKARILIQSVLLGLLIAAALLGAQQLIYWAGTAAFAPPASTEPLVDAYFSIRIWSAPAVLFVYTLSGYLLGTAQAKSVLWLQLILNISNGLLNLLFVLGLGMGVAGIALGSLIAEWLAAAFGAYLLIQNFGVQPLRKAARDKATWHLNQLNKLLSANGYIFLRTLILLAALSLITRRAALMGEASLAANQVLMTFFILISLGLDAFAHAAEAYVGAAFGKGDKKAMRFWALRTSMWALLAASLYSLVFYLGGSALIDTLTNIDLVRQISKEALYPVIMLPLFAVWGFQFDGIYVGTTSGRGMLLTMIAAFILYVSVLPSLTATYGLMGLWGAVALFMGARGLAQLIYYPWIEKRLGRTWANPT
jgi:MATE family, multidrug efflux pump